MFYSDPAIDLLIAPDLKPNLTGREVSMKLIQAAIYARASSELQATAHTIENQIGALTERAPMDGTGAYAARRAPSSTSSKSLAPLVVCERTAQCGTWRCAWVRITENRQLDHERLAARSSAGNASA